jgi:nucleoside 2-deoxyribosyltransferase
MNIYFSCSVTGGRDDQKIYKLIVDHLGQKGHEVPTAHLSEENVMGQENSVDAYDIYQRDIQWVRECDALISEVSTPSHGVGYEIALALELTKPVLCLYKQNTQVSKMIIGNTKSTLRVSAYKDISEVIKLVDLFLKSI